jgi:hypothetical protein
MEQICTLCKETKSIEYFGKHKQMKDGHLKQCKTCRKQYMKQYSEINKDTISSNHKKYYEENREQLKENVREHWRENADDINKKRRYRYKNDDTYRQKKLEECSRSNAKCRSERRKNASDNKTPSYYLELCRKRMWHAFNGREAKSDKTVNLLGCDGIFLKHYLENTKVEGKDYTDAHIDHIIPCSSFDFSDEEQQRKCFHYTNLQLLPALENLIKSNSIV